MPENCNLEEVEHIKKFVSIPVVAAGRMDPYVGAEAVKEGKIDAVGFARPFLADGAWVTKLINGHAEEIRPCICCHNGCFNMCHYKGTSNDQSLGDSLHMARCAVNAETMNTVAHHIEKAAKPKNIAIIGGGIGGMEAARVASLRGHKVSLYEKSDHLGGVFVPASQASFKGKLRDLLAWYELQMKELNVDVHLNTEVKDLSSLKADEYVVATGSKPRRFPLKGGEKAMDAIDYLMGKEVGQKVAVIGGGLTGCEVAYELFLSGKEPIIVEMKDDLVKQTGICMANSQYLRDFFAWKNVPVYLSSKLKEVKDGSIVMDTPEGEKEVACDSVILSAGYVSTPAFQESSKVHLVGDCLSVGNLRSVIWRAYEVGMKL